jgi:hypothetical protein
LNRATLKSMDAPENHDGLEPEPEPIDFQLDLEALHRMIEQIDLLVNMPNGAGIERCQKMSRVALRLSERLAETPVSALSLASIGRKTAGRGPEYFKRISATRKTKGGGRPHK